MKAFYFDFNIPVDKVRDKTMSEAATLLKLMKNKAAPNEDAPYKKHSSYGEKDARVMSKEAIYNFFADDDDDDAVGFGDPPLSQPSSTVADTPDLSTFSSPSSQPPESCELSQVENTTTMRQLFSPSSQSISHHHTEASPSFPHIPSARGSTVHPTLPSAPLPSFSPSVPTYNQSTSPFPPQMPTSTALESPSSQQVASSSPSTTKAQRRTTTKTTVVPK